MLKACSDVHGNEWDYSLITEYKNDKIKLPIICKKHGVFYQTMNNHIKARQGCPLCGIEKNNEARRYTTEHFKELANKKHNFFFIYDKVEYVDSKTYVIITCPIHGDFKQKPSNHLQGQGCPKCFFEKSKIERDIFDFVKSLTSFEVIDNDRKLLNGKEIDIFVPAYKIGIEVDGLVWHSEKVDKSKYYHIEKTKKCEDMGIRLIHILEDEWLKHEEIVKSMIRSIFRNINDKIYARKCSIKEISIEDANLFVENNTISTMKKCDYNYRFILQ